MHDCIMKGVTGAGNFKSMHKQPFSDRISASDTFMRKEIRGQKMLAETEHPLSVLNGF